MSDPVDPIDPVEPTATPVRETDATTRPTTTGLPPNVAAALACFPLIGGIIFYVLEKRDSFVRFYAMQSIIFGAAWCLFNIVSSIIHVIFASVPAIGVFLSLLWGLVGMLILLVFVVV